MTATVIHDLQQGSEEWAKFRAVHFGASEAAAMLGLSEHMTRSELLRLKATGIEPEHNAQTLAVFANGHRVEAAIRPHIEQALDDDLYPVTCSKPGTKLSASCDGLTLAGDTAFECKQWNAALAEHVRAGVVPDTHMPQCQQILMVTAAQRVIFTVSDGTPGGTVWVEVKPDLAWFDRIERGWGQFEADLATYAPAESSPAVTAAPMEYLPAPSVTLGGSLSVASNLDLFGTALRAFVEKIPKKPSTDQEFADCEASCKRLKEAEDRLQAAEDTALASMSDVEAMRRMVADLRDLARSTRLASEKLVKQRKEQIREEEVRRGVDALMKHRAALNERLCGQYMPVLESNFGGAIKGLKSLDSVRNAIDTELARAKIDASATADRIDANIRHLREHAADYPALFPDEALIVLKAGDDFAALVSSRIAEHERQEAARRQREADAAAAREREQAERAARAVQAPAAAQPTQPVAQHPAPRPAAPAADGRPTMTLGQIAHRLGFALTADFLRTLGFQATRDRSAALYRASDFSKICAALIEHVEKVRS